MNWFKGLPVGIQIALVLIFLLILYMIYRMIRKQVKKGNYNAAVNQSQTALHQLAQNGVNPSYGQAQYTSMANALETTFTGCGFDWAGIVVPTFKKLKNDADAYALIQGYGVRTIKECGWGEFTGDLASTITYKTSGIVLDLPNWSDFSNPSPDALNKIMSQNGLTFQF